MEVSEKMLTLAIKIEPKITPSIRKATIVEVSEEMPALVADPKSIIEESDAEPLKAATLDFDDVGPEGTTFLWNEIIEPEEDEMVIAYIKGEPVIGVFEKKDTPLTKEHDNLKYDYAKNSFGI